MKPKADLAITIILGAVFLFTIAAYLVFGQEWARLPFALSLLLVSLYNLFFRRPGSGKR